MGLKMIIEEILDRRMAEAKKRQEFWKNEPDLKQIYIGIEEELKSLIRELYPKKDSPVF